MNSELKKRIESINNGTAPAGYKKTKVGIVPEEWEIVRLDDICTFINGRAYKQEELLDEGKYPVLRVGNLFTNGDWYYSDLELSDEKYIDNGDLIFAWSASFSPFIWIGSRVIYHYHIWKIDDLRNIDKMFLYLFLQYDVVKMQTQTQGGTMAHITKETMEKRKIALPPLPEQQKIAEILTAQDAVIALMQKQIELLQKQKKAFLQKMFPKKGSNVPEIRFAGFTGEWERRKFSDIATTRRGLTYKPDDTVSGNKRVLRSSNINEDTFEMHEDDVFVNEGAVNIPYVKNGDILITSANGSSRLVGKHAIVRDIPDNCVVHGGFMLLASSDEPEFVNALMSSQWYTKFINVYVAGGNGTIGNLNKNDLDEQTVLVPVKNEREKIGAFFLQLDNLITLHQRKVEIEQQKKKALMQLLLTGKVRVKT